MFAGDSGHRDEVLSLCVHDLGNCFLSCGMDHSIKIWSLDTPEVKHAIKEKATFKADGSSFQEEPMFSTYRVHSVRRLAGVVRDSSVTINCKRDTSNLGLRGLCPVGRRLRSFQIHHQ